MEEIKTLVYKELDAKNAISIIYSFYMKSTEKFTF